jgi:L-ascorbate metabolism protein UlaG (beta-lactamase superfamily)
VTYIGHATLLLEIGGATLLTDPNFDSSLGKILPRVTPPGIPIEELPALNAILLTHAHADHLSFDSIDKLPRNIPLIAPPVIARWLQSKGYDHAIALGPDEQTSIGGVTIHVARATHHGNRYGFDRWRGAANMYLLDAGETIFFAGDTALVSDTHGMVENTLWRNGRELDLALLPIGYAPKWKPGFRRGHLTHEDALVLFERLRARVMIPYHWGTFRHVTATAHDAIRRLRKRLESHHLRTAVHIIEPGESFELSTITNAR